MKRHHEEIEQGEEEEENFDELLALVEVCLF
jgi:hypothetical protein